MKDVLSFLIRQNTAASALSSASEVLVAWLPLVEKLAAANERSTVQQLSSMLFCAANDDDFHLIEDNGMHKEESDTATNTQPDKSGALDNLSDDCLSHCFSFLHYTDVLLNVERSCRRLFHVSRARKTAFPFGRRKLDTQEFETKEAAMSYASFYEHKITSLSCESGSDVLSLTFPKLRKAQFRGSDGVGFADFLIRQPNVYKCSFVRNLHKDSAEFYTALASVKQVTDVRIENQSLIPGQIERALETPTVDLSNIRLLQLSFVDSWSLFRPFVHSQLTQLSLSLSTVTVAPHFDIPLPNLQSLHLDLSNCMQIAQPTLDRIRAPKLKALKVSCGFDAASRCLRLCPKGRVKLILEETDDLQQTDVCEALAQLRENRHSFAPKKLKLVLEIEDNYVFLIRFVVAMAKMFAPATVVSIASKIHNVRLEICRQLKNAGATDLFVNNLIRIKGL